MNIEAYKTRTVPELFPDSVELDCVKEPDSGTLKLASLNSTYQTDTNNEGMRFFVENVLAKINPRRMNFLSRRTKMTLSEMFTITD